ncbi:Oxidase ustYa [Hyphodiscus hymeniophilus]|uniref:Oxidase ustYa n=1 Tax=Hyphodiscus hymeniophilus TaxID=353542 RepID=A0A9P6SJV3_9HELO|nr:Oxidase ustYa [Hyphodiscus hymeniophilus]
MEYLLTKVRHQRAIISFGKIYIPNMIRQQIWSGVAGENVTMSDHIEHCIDSIRQTLMCASDITPMPFAWYTEWQVNFPVFDTLHTCRDFDAIRDWALERQSFTFDTTVQEEDPLGKNIIE